MAAFVVVLAIVAHRLLRLDLSQEWMAALRPQLVLTALLVAATAGGVMLRSVRLSLSSLLGLQWALWAWALVSKVVADGTETAVPFLRGDYTKDLIFASLVGVTVVTARRLRALMWVVVLCLTVVAAVALPQRSGARECHYFKNAWTLNYEQTSDRRPCVAASDCYTVPKSESHLRDYGWACERTGPWGLATVTDRIHYFGSLMDPNGLALALVMAAALALGLLTWPANAATAPPPLLARVLLGGAVALFGMALIFAASRAAQFALALVMLIFFYARVGWPGVVLAGLCAAPVVMVSTRNAAEAAYSTLTRIWTYINGYHALWENPLFGVGFENYGRISFINAHNSFLLALTETGLLGGALFTLGAYLPLKLALSVLLWPGAPSDRADAEELAELRHLARTLLAMLVGVTACVFFLSLAFDVLWLFPVAITAGFHRTVRERLPDLTLRLRAFEIVLVGILGALLPAGLIAVATRGW
jgi:hypothetical protein